MAIFDLFFQQQAAILIFFQNFKKTGTIPGWYFIISMSFVTIRSAISELRAHTGARTDARTDGGYSYIPLGGLTRPHGG